MADGVVEQIGQQQPDAQPVDVEFPVRPGNRDFEAAGVFDILFGDRADELAELHGFRHEHRMFLIEPLGFDQVGDQQIDFIDVLAQFLGLFAAFEKLEPQLRLGEWRAQFMADGEQQLAFGLEHRLQRIGHVVDAFGEFAEFVLAVAVDPEAEVAVADALGALLE